MTKTYDLYNPTPARRIIFRGAASKPIEIQPGQTVRAVELPDSVVSILLKAMEMGEGRALVLTEVAEPAVTVTPVPAEPPKEVPPAPPQAQPVAKTEKDAPKMVRKDRSARVAERLKR